MLVLLILLILLILLLILITLDFVDSVDIIVYVVVDFVIVEDAIGCRSGPLCVGADNEVDFNLVDVVDFGDVIVVVDVNVVDFVDSVDIIVYVVVDFVIVEDAIGCRSGPLGADNEVDFNLVDAFYLF